MSFHDVNHPIAITDVPLEERTKASADDGHDTSWITAASIQRSTVVPD